MSRENVELHRRAVQAFNARNIEAFIGCCDPDIEFHSSFAAVGGTVYRSHDGLRRWHQDLAEAWGSDIRIEPEAYFDLGERTLAFLTQGGRGTHSGLEVEMPITHVIKWQDGLATYWKVYPQREDALRDLGLSEAELDPIAP